MRLAPGFALLLSLATAAEGHGESGAAPNDIDAESFDYIADTVVDLYAESFAQRQIQPVVNKRWDADEANALSSLTAGYDRKAQRSLRVWEIELKGGLARHPLLSRDAFALVVCHEVGHHVGGAPYAAELSSEGQADYFATASCMKRYLRKTRYPPSYWREQLPPELGRACAVSFPVTADQAICRRSILAAFTLSRWIADTNGVKAPALTRQDATVRAATLAHGYPGAQCRLDTLVAGALCPIDNETPEACTRQEGYEREARPRCWFKPPSGP